MDAGEPLLASLPPTDEVDMTKLTGKGPVVTLLEPVKLLGTPKRFTPPQTADGNDSDEHEMDYSPYFYPRPFLRRQNAFRRSRSVPAPFKPAPCVEKLTHMFKHTLNTNQTEDFEMSEISDAELLAAESNMMQTYQKQTENDGDTEMRESLV